MELDFIIHRKPVYCIDLDFDNKEMYYNLIELLFYKNVEFITYHVNVHSKEKMLIVSEDGYNMLTTTSGGYVVSKKYHIIQMINTNEYMDDSGLVAKISTLFSENNIPILYITTSQSNFVFIEVEDLVKSGEILSKLTNNVTYI
jgi:hypothetical protein